MLLPIIRGAHAAMVEATMGFDTGAIPDLVISPKLFASRDLGAELRAGLRASLLWPSGRVEVELTEKVRSPGAGLCLLAELLSLTRSGSQDPEDAGVMCWGGVDFNGKLRAARGTFAVAHLAQNCGYAAIAIPRSAMTAKLDRLAIGVIACDTISDFEVASQDWGQAPHVGHHLGSAGQKQPAVSIDRIKGLSLAKLAVEVMIAGRHHAALIGSEGSGKSAIARTLRSVMPRDLSDDLSCIESVTGHEIYHETAAVRMPHSTTSRNAMLGSAYIGEVTLAHLGVLVLDDAPMFAASIMRDITSIMSGQLEPAIYQDGRLIPLPGAFVALVLAKPCPCGKHPCRDSFDGRHRWIERGRRLIQACPIRVDMHDAQEVDRDQSQAAILQRIETARALIAGRVTGVAETLAALDGRTQPSDDDDQLAGLLSLTSW